MITEYSEPRSFPFGADLSQRILTVNGGSSSARFALYNAEDPTKRLFEARADRIGLKGTTFQIQDGTESQGRTQDAPGADYATCVDLLLKALEADRSSEKLSAIGHRIVHGMHHTEPERISAELMDELRRITPYDPDHLPGEIRLIEEFRSRFPDVPQVACFDTSFHRAMPRVAKMLPIPRRYDDAGVQRYGFHGLSYTYLMASLCDIQEPAAMKGRMILAHLGNGASLAAILDGHCVDTSMGFTPSAGLMMGTRSGDVDPGLIGYLSNAEGMTIKQFESMANHESGLLGVSQTSSDMHDLLMKERDDVRAAEAIQLFCYQVKKWIGSFTAVLGGLDALVFTGGIGENAPLIRSRICEGLEFLGIELSGMENTESKSVISSRESKVTVRVIRTDEESVIARAVLRALGLGIDLDQACAETSKS